MRDVIRNFNADRFGSLYPKCKGGPRGPESRNNREDQAQGHGGPCHTRATRQSGKEPTTVTGG